MSDIRIFEKRQNFHVIFQKNAELFCKYKCCISREGFSTTPICNHNNFTLHCRGLVAVVAVNVTKDCFETDEEECHPRRELKNANNRACLFCKKRSEYTNRRLCWIHKII